MAMDSVEADDRKQAVKETMDDKRDEWVEEQVTQQIKDGDVVAEFLCALDYAGSNKKVRDFFVEKILFSLKEDTYNEYASKLGVKIIDLVVDELNEKYKKQYDADHKNDQ